MERKIKIFSTLALLFFSFLLFGQIELNYCYPNDTVRGLPTSLIKTSNNQYLISFGDERLFENYVGLLRINEIGEELMFNHFLKPFGRTRDIHEMVDGSIILSGYRELYYAQVWNFPFFIRLDSFGNQIWNIELDSIPEFLYPISKQTITSPDKSTLLFTNSNQLRGLDMNGNIILDTSFIDYGFPDFQPRDIQSTENEILILGIIDAKLKLIKLSHQFEFLEINDLIGIDDGEWIEDRIIFKSTIDNGFLIASVKKEVDEEFYWMASKFDQNGDISWQRTYHNIDGYFPAENGLNTPFDIIESGDGNYFITGTMNKGSGGFISTFSPIILKVDSLGFPLWLKELEGNELASRILLDQDKIIGTGYNSNDPNNSCIGVYLRTIDTIPDLILSDYFQSNIQSKASLYPNPVLNKIYIQNSAESFKIKIYSAQGELVLTSNQAQINVVNLPVGVYFLQLINFNNPNQTFKFIKSN